ncbi:MAG: excinuclease ABC subunit UvrA [Clostridia bacterium]|jgi:excinuclease ABC subunit A|nr:excinuclease ABC subunit UvrA [Clostridia bacterium]
MNYIKIKGAREHNLKNIDVNIPRDKMVVITGLSGSGKSSLAFDTIYAEGQRRYVESLSAYARQFLGQMEKPDVDHIDGLSPAISIDQKTTSRNPRSTVGTVTEIHDYLRLIYARAGIVHCPKCGKKIDRQTVDQMVDDIQKMPDGTKLMIMAPVISGRKGEHVKLLEDLSKSGYTRVVVDGITYTLDEEIKLEKNKKHTIDVVVDRLVLKDEGASRLHDSVETGLGLGDGVVKIFDMTNDTQRRYSQNYACIDCGISIDEISPRMFSFNNPYGACPHCHGLGTIMKIDEDLIVPDRSLSLSEGAVRVSGWDSASNDSWGSQYFKGMSRHFGFDMNTPFKDLDEDVQNKLLFGTNNERFQVDYVSDYGKGTFLNKFEGIITNLERRYLQTDSDYMKGELEKYMTKLSCPVCKGARLRPEPLAVKLGGKNIAQLSHMSIDKAMIFLDNLQLSEKQRIIADRVLKELKARLDFLLNVGLSYLTLSRNAGTLSGGEAQRIRLATQIGSGLTGVLYILDEPSIGLHQRDNRKLLATLRELQKLGNTLIVVEHDEDTIRNADHVIDIGPGAGVHGGQIVSAGTPEHIANDKNSITGQYLSGAKSIPVPSMRRKSTGTLSVIGARENNLKNITVNFPLSVITAVTGVSGSGKSTLVNEILYKSLAKAINKSKMRPGKHDRVEGMEYIDKVVDIDQSPIGRTPRSNPATYTKVFTHIRDLFASTKDAKVRGYGKGRFSFNVKGGRCEACHGDGIIKIEMHFLPDVYVPCEVCKGARYSRETLEVRYKGKNIQDVLEMTVEEATDFFSSIPSIYNKLKVLDEVGLGYVKLGQPSTTLSGGEAQRVKLATHLSKRQTGNTLFLLDEPTTGLHADDVKKLVAILARLADKGNTLIVIEHNLDVIKSADYCIDLGPNGGDGGGKVIASGTPEQIAKVKKSATGEYLKPLLD